MPRRSKHSQCGRCGKHVKVCALVSWYVVGCTSHPGAQGGQVKGALPSHGFCLKCFLRLAKEQSVKGAELRKLTRRLEEAVRP
jgi:hypothetical protein